MSKITHSFVGFNRCNSLAGERHALTNQLANHLAGGNCAMHTVFHDDYVYDDATADVLIRLSTDDLHSNNIRDCSLIFTLIYCYYFSG